MLHEKHQDVLKQLDRAGSKHICLIPGKNLVDQISALVNGIGLNVAITKTRFGYFAAVEYDGMVHSKWSRTPSTAVTLLATEMKKRIE